MDQVFTPQFWQEVIAKAPWVIPSLLIGGLVGWKWKGANDDGEIRGLRAEINGVRAELGAAAQRLELVREKYEAVVNRENELGDKIARQEKVIAELRKAEVAPPRFVELSTSSTDIKNALTNLSTSTTNLGQELNRLGTLQTLRNLTGRYILDAQSTLPSE
jgi:chromosome segregation ATPase